ncbi:MAG: MgtC/SapB family protein [Saprospiraceae bacterium]|nr:MgtC/SapB family protein [Saprospiraceae bacterium]MDW8228587.1 MgtC/SapB family protein [Saprospiraceae bacterium]
MDTAWLSFLPSFFQGLIIALGTGLVLGLEREHQQSAEPYSFAGLRTFSLMSITGYLTAKLAVQAANTWLIPLVALGVLLLITVAYWVQAERQGLGITTEIALFVSYLSGNLVAVGYAGEAFGGAVTVAVLLSLKTRFKLFIKQISQEELAAFLKFFVLIVLALLLLPDAYFGPDNLLHYRSIGWVILLVSSISLTGYLLLKFGGAGYGILGTAFVGGLFSSTLVAWAFSARSRETPQMAALFSGGILLSSSVMYLRVLFLTRLFAPELTRQLLLPCALMFLVNALVVGFLYAPRRGQQMDHVASDIPLGNPLDLKNALYFAVLYVGVSLFMHYSRQELGESGSFASAAFSGIADMDAITISTSQWAQRMSTYDYAARTIVIAALSNTVFKALLVLVRSHPHTRKYATIGFSLVCVAGALWLAFH